MEKSDVLQLVGNLAKGCEEGHPVFLHSLPRQESEPPTSTPAQMRKSENQQPQPERKGQGW